MTAEPNGCRYCGIPERTHARQWTEAAGWHTWTEPTAAQISGRMLARRNARTTPEETTVPELTATLVISRSHSYCGNCREETLPSATHHVDISGWTPKPGEGCGARFVDMRSDNSAVDPEDLKSIRPDLPVHVDPAEDDDRPEPCGENSCHCYCATQHGPCGCDCPRDPETGQLTDDE